MTIGVVVAHPDDETLGMGGTIARLTAEGETVHLLMLSGERTTRDGEEGASILGARGASEILSAASFSYRLFPDNSFDTVRLLDIVRSIEVWLDRLQLAVLYTHFAGDLNIDHRITAQAVIIATRPMQGCSVRELYTFEVPSSTEWAFGCTGPAFAPNVFYDISATIETKIKAMACYESECRPWPHPRSPEALRAIAQRWGSVVGCDYAEAFQLVRAIR